MYRDTACKIIFVTRINVEGNGKRIACISAEKRFLITIPVLSVAAALPSTKEKLFLSSQMSEVGVG